MKAVSAVSFLIVNLLKVFYYVFQFLLKVALFTKILTAKLVF